MPGASVERARDLTPWLMWGPDSSGFQIDFVERHLVIDAVDRGGRRHP